MIKRILNNIKMSIMSIKNDLKSHYCYSRYPTVGCMRNATLKYTSPDKSYTCYLCEDCASKIIRATRFNEELLGTFEYLDIEQNRKE